jgi:hypothetical protein
LLGSPTSTASAEPQGERREMASIAPLRNG